MNNPIELYKDSLRAVEDFITCWHISQALLESPYVSSSSFPCYRFNVRVITSRLVDLTWTTTYANLDKRVEGIQLRRLT